MLSVPLKCGFADWAIIGVERERAHQLLRRPSSFRGMGSGESQRRMLEVHSFVLAAL